MIPDKIKEFIANINIESQHEYYPATLVEQMKALGLFGTTVPVDFGGLGLADKVLLMIIKELAARCMPLTSILSSHLKVCSYINHFGTKEQKDYFLPQLASGSLIAAHACTERSGKSPEYFCTVLSTQELKPDIYYLSGEKTYVTNAQHADIIAVVAKQLPAHCSIVLLDRETQGLKISTDIERLGYHGVSICSLTMKECAVEEHYIIGGKELDAQIMMSAVKINDLLNYSARAIGITETLLDETKRYCCNKKSDGRTLKDIPQVRVRLAELQARCSWMNMMFHYFLSQEKIAADELVNAYAIKIFTTETTTECAKMAMKLHGGAGYMSQFSIERLFRDAMALCLIGTSTEIALDRISEAMFLSYD